MDIGAGRNKERPPALCYRCGEPGHFKGDPKCKLKYDVRGMDAEELQTYLEDELARMDTPPTNPSVDKVGEDSEEKPEPKDFHDHNE
jgi:hypothetical protein